jgi:serine/threonine protein kinase
VSKRQISDIRARQYGQWEVVGWLGGGGAGDVYEVRNADDERAALKVFRRTRRFDVAKRYELELDFVNTHREYPGLLPFIDSQLDPSDNESLWFAMPFALPLDKARDVLADSYEVIRSVATVAATLGDLSLQGVHHRNIKPSNIFIHEGKAVVGDFALIPHDNTIDLTDLDKVRAAQYLAPELDSAAQTVQAGETIDWEKADVYSLARVLEFALGPQVNDILGLADVIKLAVGDDVKERPNLARLSGELFSIYDSSEIAVLPEASSELDAAVGRLNQVLEGETTDDTRRTELVRQSRASYAALVASTLGAALDSLSRVKSLQVQETKLDDDQIDIPERRAHLLHKGGDALIATVPGATLTIAVSAGFWNGIQSELVKVSVQREWGEAKISMRIHWEEVDRETEVWSFAWQQTLRAARSARSFNDLARRTIEHLAVAYEQLSNWVERRELPES